MEKISRILFYSDYEPNIRFHYDEHEKELLFNSDFRPKQKENIIIDYENYNFINLLEICQDVSDEVFENNISFFRTFYSGTTFPNVLVPNSLEDIIIDFKDSIKLEKTQFFKKVIANAYTNAKSIKLSNLQESILNIGLNDIEDKFERIYDMIYAQVYVNFIKFIVYESQLDTPEDYLKQNSLYVNHQRFQKTGDFFSFDF